MVSAPPRIADVVLLSASQLVAAVNAVDSAVRAHLVTQQLSASGKSQRSTNIVPAAQEVRPLTLPGFEPEFVP